MKQVEITTKYKLGHSYKFLYEQTDYFCPSCGKQSVWVEKSEGDFYAGPTYICETCVKEFNMPNTPRLDPETTPQIVEQIKEGESYE